MSHFRISHCEIRIFACETNRARTFSHRFSQAKLYAKSLPAFDFTKQFLLSSAAMQNAHALILFTHMASRWACLRATRCWTPPILASTSSLRDATSAGSTLRLVVAKEAALRRFGNRRGRRRARAFRIEASLQLPCVAPHHLHTISTAVHARCRSTVAAATQPEAPSRPWHVARALAGAARSEQQAACTSDRQQAGTGQTVAGLAGQERQFRM